MLTTKEALRRLVNDRKSGWDRVAEAMIARVFYGGCEGMVRHYIGLLENLEAEERSRAEIHAKFRAIIADRDTVTVTEPPPPAAA